MPVFTAVLTISFLAGLFRGFLGFGFSLIAVPLMSLAWPLGLTLPVVLTHEIILAATLLPRQTGLVDTKSVRTLLIASACCAPLGITLIRFADEHVVRSLIGAILILCVPVLWRDSRQQFVYNGFHAVFFGGLSGVLTGWSALSGPPVIMYFLRKQTSAGIARASLMAYFLINSIIVLAMGLALGAYDRRFFLDAVLLAPTSLAGSVLGAMLFAKYASVAYRKTAMAFIGLLGVIMIATGLGIEFHTPF